MARVEKVSECEAGPFGRFAYRLSRRSFGEVVEPLAVMARQPRLLSGYEYFGEAQLVEPTAAIALENHRVRFNHAFGIGSQGFSEGSRCAVPEVPAMTEGVGSR